MKIKPGYKQTEVGVIPEDWDVQQLGELVNIINGGTPHTNEPSYWNGGIMWCAQTDITRHAGKYLTETERTISHDGLNNSGANLLPVGAVLLCSRATIGEVKIAGVPISTNQGFRSLVCRPEANNEFLYYKLLTMKEQMVARASGSTFLEISPHNVSTLKIALPSLNEQTAIAAVLSDVDALLDGLDRLVAKKRAIKLATMQQLLTGKKQTAQLPDGWRRVKLAEVCDIKADRPPKFDGEKPYYDTSAVDVMGIERVPVMVTYHNRPSRADCYPQQNAVGFAKMKGTRKTVLIDDAVTGAIFSTGFQFLMPKNDDVHPYFLFALVGSDFFQNEKDGVTPDGIMGGIPLKSVAKLTVTLPPLPEQKKIAAVLSDMDDEIAALGARREKTRALKYAMMGELLTGKTRLVKPKQKNANA